MSQPLVCHNREIVSNGKILSKLVWTKTKKPIGRFFGLFVCFYIFMTRQCFYLFLRIDILYMAFELNWVWRLCSPIRQNKHLMTEEKCYSNIKEVFFLLFVKFGACITSFYLWYFVLPNLRGNELLTCDFVQVSHCGHTVYLIVNLVQQHRSMISRAKSWVWIRPSGHCGSLRNLCKNEH